MPFRSEALWGVLLAAIASVSLIGCSQSADSLSQDNPASARVRSVPVPKNFDRLPSAPRVLIHSASPARVVGDLEKRLVGKVSPPVAERVEELLVSGPIGRFLGSVRGEVMVGVYGKDDDPRFVGFVPGLDVDRWNETLGLCLDDPNGKPVMIGGRELRENRAGDEVVFHGMVPGGWVFGNDRTRVGHVVAGETSGLAEMVETSWSSVAKSPPGLFVSVDLAGLLTGAEERQQAAILGVDGVNRVSLALFEDGGKKQDTVFVHTSAPHGGVLGVLAGPPLKASTIASLPSTTEAFCAVSIDLASFWKNLSTSLPPQIAQQVSMAEQGLGFDLEKDLLSTIGSSLMVTKFAPAPGAKPVTLFSLALADRGGLEELFAELGPKSPVPLNFEAGPGGAKFLAVPPTGGPPVGVALTDDAILVCETRSGLDAYLAGRAGTETPAELTALFQRHGGTATVVSWARSQSFSGAEETEKFMDQAFANTPAAALPIRQLADAFPWEELTGAMGDVGFVVVPEKAGLRFTVETDTGLMPLLSLVAGAGFEGEMARRTRQSIDPVATAVIAAQEAYHKTHDRYADSLWELKRSGLVDATVAAGVRGHLVYRVVRDGKSWKLEAKSDRSSQRFVVQADGTLVSTK